MNYKPIKDYGLIGDLNTTALVGMDGSIDFMCFPQFDSPTIFAALLDYRKGGCFLLAPEIKNARNKQLYLPDSNVLLTRFLSEGGMAEVSDFMPITQFNSNTFDSYTVAYNSLDGSVIWEYQRDSSNFVALQRLGSGLVVPGPAPRRCSKSSRATTG